jgi:hypothetical protein
VNLLFAALFTAIGAYHLWVSWSAVRTGKVVWRLWWSSGATYRDEDLTGFNAALTLNTVMGVGFLFLAGFAASI